MATRYAQSLPRDLRFEPTPKLIRATLGSETVLETVDAVIVWEPGRAVPVYAIPAGDIEPDFFQPEAELDEQAHTAALAASWSVENGCGRRPHAAWSYADRDLSGHLALRWDALDAWFEEEERVLGHPHDPYHGIDVRRSGRHLEVRLDGQRLADSRRPTLLFETGLPVRAYLPASDVRMDLLEESQTRTVCAYKGEARYFSAEIDGTRHDDIAWSYPRPLPDQARIRDLICFFSERVDVLVDGELQERPQTQWS